LSLLQERGLHILFSSALVRPEMRIEQEPRSRQPRKALEELLAPHGLAVQDGPGGDLLVVRARAGAPPVEPVDAKPAVPPPEKDPARFRETVEVEDEAPKEGALSSAVNVRPLEVMAVAGAAENVYRAIQMLPGVTGLNEIEGRVAVRGGGPDQNLTVMDGIEVHNPYRLFGLTSAFNPETVEKFELVTGAFHPRYGDRLSSILVVDTRSGRREKAFRGSSALSLTDANVILEGRLPGPASGSWLLTGRRTYYDLVLGSLAERADLPSFADLQLKLAWEPGPGRKLSLLALRNRESGAVESGRQDEFRTSVRNEIVSLRFSTPVGHAVAQTVASWYENQDKIGLRDEARPGVDPRDSRDIFSFLLLTARDFRIRDVSLRQEVAYPMSPRHLLGSGLDLHGIETAVAWRLSAGDPEDLFRQGPWTRPDGPGRLDGQPFPTRFRGGLWVHDRFQASPRLSLETGLRLDHGGITPATTLSPRASARFRLDESTVLGAALGLHTQSTGFEKFLQRQFIFDGTSMFDLTGLSSSGLRSERALHLVTSAERRLGGALDLRLEAFYKRFRDLVVGRLETEEERQARLSRYDFPEGLRGNLPTELQLTRVPTNDGRGRAYGIELLLSRRPASPEARLSGWVSYTFGIAQRQAYGVTYPFDYDRRHAASMVAVYRPTRSFELAGALKLASGFPWRAPLGARIQGIEDTTDRDGDGNRTELVPVIRHWYRPDGTPYDAYGYEPYFAGPQDPSRLRGPSYGRLDMRAAWHPRWWGGRWTLYLDVINVLGHHNYNGSSWRQVGNPELGEPVTFVPDRSNGTGLPRVPSLGFRVAF
jgi:TonB-dependent receptor-like protein